LAIVAGFDVHRGQITFDALDTETGEVDRGRMAAAPQAVREWPGRFAGEDVHVAVEACTGWLFVCEALAEAGATPQLAEPAETRAAHGKNRRAKTDREDARWARVLLAEGRLPEAWMASAHVREWRTRTRLRKTLVDERTSWLARVQATLFQHGVAAAPNRLLSARGREFLADVELPAAARERIEVALTLVEAIHRQLAPLERELGRLARRQTGCAGRSTRRPSRPAGPAALTTPTTSRSSSVGSRTRASITIARKLARRCFHTLRQLGPEALAPVT
jgi:transposase